MIQETIYQELINSAELVGIFGDNIFPLSSQKQVLPILYYELEQTGVAHSKNSSSRMDTYRLKFHLFGLDYLELESAKNVLRELFDYRSMAGTNLFRFEGFTEDFTTENELYTKTVNFSFTVSRN